MWKQIPSVSHIHKPEGGVIVLEESKEEKEIPFGRLIHVISRKLKQHNLISGEDMCLTPMQKHILKFILLETMHRDLYQKDVEEEFKIRRSTTTGILQLMEKNGFIYRESVAKDARLKRIIPTKKAEALREQILENIVQREKKMTHGIKEEDLTLCRAVLKQILANLTEEQEEK